jgi:hypothetical protein
MQRSPSGYSDGPNVFLLAGSNPVNLTTAAGYGSPPNGPITTIPFALASHSGTTLGLTRHGKFMFKVRVTFKIKNLGASRWVKIGEENHTHRRVGKWLIFEWDDVEIRVHTFKITITTETWRGYLDGRPLTTNGELVLLAPQYAHAGRGERGRYPSRGGFTYTKTKRSIKVDVLEFRNTHRIEALYVGSPVNGAGSPEGGSLSPGEGGGSLSPGEGGGSQSPGGGGGSQSPGGVGTGEGGYCLYGGPPPSPPPPCGFELWRRTFGK